MIVIERAWQTQDAKDKILIGTTETLFTGSPEDITVSEDDINYLIEVYNHYFSFPVCRQDVVNSYAGLRVLIANDRSAFHRSRETLIHYNEKKIHRCLVFMVAS